MSKNLENQLRLEIQAQLKNTSNTICPKVNQRTLTESGYRWVEEQIINMVLETGQSPAMCIPQIESEL